MPSLENQIFGGHIQTSTLNPTARLPRQPAVAREHTSYDHGHSRKDMLRRPSFRTPHAYRLRTGRAGLDRGGVQSECVPERHRLRAGLGGEIR